VVRSTWVPSVAPSVNIRRYAHYSSNHQPGGGWPYAQYRDELLNAETLLAVQGSLKLDRWAPISQVDRSVHFNAAFKSKCSALSALLQVAIL
jgi:hypothetical protein